MEQERRSRNYIIAHIKYYAVVVVVDENRNF